MREFAYCVTPVTPLQNHPDEAFSVRPALVGVPVCAPAMGEGAGRRGPGAGAAGGDEQRRVVDVSCGDDHSLVSTADGAVYVWGRGTQAALGLGGATKNATRPVLLPSRC
jgi:hypothetical protein